MISYEDVDGAAKQVFEAQLEQVHPFFRPYFTEVFADYSDNHLSLRDCADTMGDVLSDNVFFLKRTTDLCLAAQELFTNYHHNGRSAGWTKLTESLALNGKLTAALRGERTASGEAWIFSRCAHFPDVIETIHFTLEDRPGTAEKIFFKGSVPDIYARYAIMTGLERLGRSTPILWSRGSCDDPGLG